MEDFEEFVDEVVEEMNFPYRLPKRYIRDALNPFEWYRPREFLSRYRFSKDTVFHLILPLVEESLAKDTQRGLPISPLNQLLCALRYYGTGSIQLTSADLGSISQPTVSRIIKRVSEGIASHLRRIININNANHLDNTRHFFNVAGFPNCSMLLDGTHILIKNPGGENGEVFRNRKRKFSLNVQIACGPNLDILDIVVRYPGSMHDNTIFERSRLRLMFEQNQVPGKILADNGYACQPYLLTPVINPTTRAEENYNRAHKATRQIVERTNGVLKGRFQVLLKGFTLDSLDTSVAAICACAVLHNLRRQEDELDEPVPDDPNQIEIIVEDQNVNALALRRAFIMTHFNY